MTEVESPQPQSESEVRDLGHSKPEGRGSNAPLKMAVWWLLNSGILISEKDDQDYGAVYSHYRGERDRYEVVYAEATGYMISLLRFLYSRNPVPALVGVARASGDWLARWAKRNDGIIAQGLREGVEIRKAYAFDNGICCKGLLDVYELTGDERYLGCAGRIANWIVHEALNEDGSVKPVFDIDAARFTENGRIWYEVSGSFHAKIAMPLLQLFSLNKDTHLEDAAMRICEWAIAQQQPDGSFPANKRVKTTFLHFHCYTVEALLYAYACQRLQRFADAAERAIDWMLGIQAPDGALPRWHGDVVREKASDVQAQVARALSLLNLLRPRKEIGEGSRRALNYLLQLQGVDQNKRTKGGFFEGSVRKHRLLVRRTLNMTSWATMFAIHALSLKEGAPSYDFFSEARLLF